MDCKRVLVVEDDAAIRQGIVDALRFAGYDVIQARNGNEGLTEAMRASFDLLLLDLILPGVGGFEILEAQAGKIRMSLVRGINSLGGSITDFPPP